VSLFVWLPDERAKWVKMRAKRDRVIRAMFAQWTPISKRPKPRGWSCRPPPPPRTGHKSV